MDSLEGLVSNIWFTSDLHFGHTRLLEFCRSTRRGETIEEHDELLVEAFNSVIKKGDTLYILGDECLGDRDEGYANISRINGQKHLIRGNHTQLRKQEHKDVFESISDLKKISIKLEDGKKQQIIMCHFPIAEWENAHNGSIHLFGHLHGNTKNIKHLLQYKCMDVGIDARNGNLMLPFHIDEVLDKVKNRDIMTHH